MNNLKILQPVQDFLDKKFSNNLQNLREGHLPNEGLLSKKKVFCLKKQ